MGEYCYVVCEACDRPIPVLEYEQTKLRRNPTDFEALCLSCRDKSLYNEASLDRYHLERVRAFLPVVGFYYERA
jgi:hypothetical protein